MKIGDKVRFLSETGGGVVAGFQGKDVVLVEDEDGFQIPTSVADVVVTNSDDYSMTKMVEKKMESRERKQNLQNSQDRSSIKALLQEGTHEMEPETVEEDIANKEITFRLPVEERSGGDRLTAFLAFVPKEKGEHPSYDTYLVNDSNYSVQVVYCAQEDFRNRIRFQGEIAPNTKQWMETVKQDDLNGLHHVSVQILFFKRHKEFVAKAPVNVQLKIDAVKFFKAHSFVENDFFESPALLYTLVVDDKEPKALEVDSKELEQRVLASKKIKADLSPFSTKQGAKGELLVIDLHATELLETTAGMDAGDILNYQMDKFRETMNAYKHKRGQKLIFIHGKGEGVLRQAIVHELNYKYKNAVYQDASFREYGYGATQVTIK